MTRRVIPTGNRPFQAYPIWAYALPPPITDYLLCEPPGDAAATGARGVLTVAFTLIAHLTESCRGCRFSSTSSGTSSIRWR